MAGFVLAIHAFDRRTDVKTWMPRDKGGITVRLIGSSGAER
jgi:hypothetical protein